LCATRRDEHLQAPVGGARRGVKIAGESLRLDKRSPRARGGPRVAAPRTDLDRLLADCTRALGIALAGDDAAEDGEGLRQLQNDAMPAHDVSALLKERAS